MPRKRVVTESAPKKTHRITEQERREYVGELESLRESIADLELALDSRGWQKLQFGTDQEFSRDGLKKMIALSRVMFLKNPLINRGVSIQAIYIWAQGCRITAKDPAVQADIEAFLAEPSNVQEFSGHQARTMKECELQVTGNLFWVMFPDHSNGTLKVRTIPVDQVTKIITNPQDSTQPWFYVREWQMEDLNDETGEVSMKPSKAYYPDLGYVPETQRPTMGGAPIMWDTPVFHVRVGGLPSMRFGMPETYAALDWAQRQKEFLENWCTLMRAYSRIAWTMINNTGPEGRAAAKTKLETTYGNDARTESNPPMVTGSWFIQDEQTKLTPMKTAGSTTSSDEGRALVRMVAMSFGMPETFFADVSTGNLATAKSLDRPTELKFRDRQELWKHIQRVIITFKLQMAQQSSSGRIRQTGVEDLGVEITFPPILEHDPLAEVQAIVAATTLGGSPVSELADKETASRLLLEALGVQNIDPIVTKILAQIEKAAANPEVAPPVKEALRIIGQEIRGLTLREAA